MTTLEAPVQTKPQPFRHPHQVFEYLWHAWDIAKLIKAKDNEEIVPLSINWPDYKAYPVLKFGGFALVEC